MNSGCGKGLGFLGGDLVESMGGPEISDRRVLITGSEGAGVGFFGGLEGEVGVGFGFSLAGAGFGLGAILGAFGRGFRGLVGVSEKILDLN